MTDHEIRVRVAELAGWQHLQRDKFDDDLLLGHIPGRRYTEEVPDYPNDLNAAVAAVEARGRYHLSINNCGGDRDCPCWAQVYDPENPDPAAVADAIGRTMAEAVCLALLKAEGVIAGDAPSPTR